MQLPNGTKRNALASALGLLMLLSGCASVQPVACPKIPRPPALVETGAVFLPRMQDFLSGKLPEPMNSESPSTPASGGQRK